MSRHSLLVVLSTALSSSFLVAPALAQSPPLTECPEEQPSPDDLCDGLEDELCEYGTPTCCYGSLGSDCTCAPGLEFLCLRDGDGISRFLEVPHMDLCLIAPGSGGKSCGSSCDGCEPPEVLTECPLTPPSPDDVCMGIEGESCAYGPPTCCYGTADSDCFCGQPVQHRCESNRDGDGVSRFQTIISDFCMQVNIPGSGGKMCGSTCDGCTRPQLVPPPPQTKCPESQPSNGDACTGLEEELCEYGPKTCCHPSSTADCVCQSESLFTCLRGGDDDTGVSYFQQLSADACMTANMPGSGGNFCGSSCDGCNPPLCPAENDAPDTGDACDVDGLLGEGKTCGYFGATCCYPDATDPNAACSCSSALECDCGPDGTFVCRTDVGQCGSPDAFSCGSSCDGCDLLPSPVLGGSYCTWGPDYECYETGWPACCSDVSEECPEEKPLCDNSQPPGSSYCTWGPDYSCYETGWPACCSDDSQEACPDDRPPCDSDGSTKTVTGTSYCTWGPDYDCFKTGHPACCSDDSQEACPDDRPSCDNECPKERESANLQVAYDTPQDCENCRKFKAGRTHSSETCDGWDLVYVLGHRANVTALSCPDTFILSMSGPDQSPFSDAERAFFGRMKDQVSASEHASSAGSLDMTTVMVSEWLEAWPADDFPVSFEYPCDGGGSCPDWFDPSILPTESCLPDDPNAPTFSPTGRPVFLKVSPQNLVSEPEAAPASRNLGSEPMASP